MKRTSFTLIELLVVIAVIGIIMGVALPSFTRIAKGKETNQAAAEIRSQLAIARSYAITNRVTTALIFPQALNGKMEGIDVATDMQPTAYFNASCRAAVVYKNNGKYKFKYWIPDSEWAFLPFGIIIPPGNDNFQEDGGAEVADVQNVKYGAIFKKTTDTTLISESDAGYTKDTDRAVIFKPDGAIVSNDNKSVRLRLAEAMFDPTSVGSSSFKFIPANKSDASNIPYTVITVNPLTGKSSVSYDTGTAW